MLAAAYDLALMRTGALITPGMSEAELRAVETRYEFTFAREHRLMLSLALPLDPVQEQARPLWPNWRQPDTHLNEQVARPVHGLLGAVRRERLWLDEWPPMPSSTDDAVALAKELLASAPRLVPVRGFVYLPGAEWAVREPLVSVYEEDVYVFDDDLLTWLEQQCRLGAGTHCGQPLHSLALWSAVMQLPARAGLSTTGTAVPG